MRMLILYQNIKKYRKLKGMSQNELAKKTGYTNRSAISRIEKGEIDLPQSKIVSFAEALGVDVSILMGETAYDISLGNITEQMTDEQKRRLLAYARFLLKEE